MRARVRAFGIVHLLVIATASISAAQTKSESDSLKFFQERALPVLQKHCFECHSHASGKAKGGLVLDSRSGWEKGGESGPAIAPGRPEDSLLIQAINYADLEMPPKGKLPSEAIDVLTRWVKEGAIDPRVAPSSTKAAELVEKGRDHWAFRAIPKKPATPKIRDETWPLDDVDRFILAELEKRGLQPAAEADRHTWLRRVSLDLTGLPPTPEAIADFLADSTGTAHAKVVNRLLGSRAYGERWGRHWLDLVGYADQIGTANDIFAEHAWRYRDYVIDAYASDKPYDQFIREQVAGDLLPHASVAQRESRLIATGFLLLGDLTIVEADKAKLRVDVVDQQVDKIGRAFLGMTIGCARCHDHKFDPISQRDYYAIAGILNSTESIQRAEWGVWSWPAVSELPETEAARTRREALAERDRGRIVELKAERDRLLSEKKSVDEVLGKPAGDPKKEDPARSLLAKVQTRLNEQIGKLDRDILHAEFFAASRPKAFAVRDAAKPGDMNVTIRGNVHAPGDLVPRGFLTVASAGPAPRFSPGESGRMPLADWIVHPDNPLTARVLVNRVWQKLFGEGIVRSVDYFGLPGDRPSHPELLDFLARRFVEDGWSQRRLIRSLVLGRAYRLSGRAGSQLVKQDPDNRLFGRMNRRRLDAEAIRDSLLAVSGRLLDSNGGPCLPLEYRENTGNLEKGAVNPPSFRLGRFRPEQEFERTVYLPIIRSAPQEGPGELRNVFDFQQPAEFAWRRTVTAVPTQALFLMNAKLMKDRSRDLARRVVEERSNEADRLEWLWLRVFNRPISNVERSDGKTYLAELRDEFTRDKLSDVEQRSWAELCHALLASNEFLMRM